EMKEKTGVDLVIETFKEIPEDIKPDYNPARRRQFFAKWAEDRVTALGTHGVYILLCRNPESFQVEVSKDVERKRLFTAANKNELISELQKAFKAEKFDEGLNQAVEYVTSTVREHARSKTTRAEDKTPPGKHKEGAHAEPEDNPILRWVCVGLVA